MENLVKAFSGKKVWLSGHTGFKGSWMSEWLIALGAKVHGFALPPHTKPALFDQLALAGRMHHEIGDIRDAGAVTASIAHCRPDFVFHMAAQPLVRLSYLIPVETFNTNVIGTLHVLNALQQIQKSKRTCVAVMITTDKCYENNEWLCSYREDDAMGGHDPYSASKGAAEIAIHSMRRSFFNSADSPVRVASARAGNVIGGGDWADDRIIPDTVRALKEGRAVPVRNRTSTRPWQHVLEPLSGYLSLAAALSNISKYPVLQQAVFQPGLSSAAFNFGPHLASNQTVADLVREFLLHWPGQWEDRSDASAPHEASKLNLATDKAFHTIRWSPRWDFSSTVARTAEWYKESCKLSAASDFRELTVRQINKYQEC